MSTTRRPFTKADAADHFLWTLIAGFAVMVGVLVLSYQNQLHDPASVPQYCSPSVCAQVDGDPIPADHYLPAPNMPAAPAVGEVSS